MQKKRKVKNVEANIKAIDEVRARDSMSAKTDPLTCALRYHATGLNVLPAKFRDKMPHDGTRLIDWKQDGYQERRVTEEELREWFGNGRLLNIGFICGKVSGNVCDLEFDDAAAYRQWATAHPDAAKTLTYRSKRGYHVLFCSKDTRSFKHAHGEWRGDGCFSVLPPSVHPSGHVYHFLDSDAPIMEINSPADIGIVPVKSPLSGNGSGAAAVGETIPETQRHNRLLSIAGAMRRQGATFEEILSALKTANEQRCTPPLPDAEVVELAADVTRRYEPEQRQPNHPSTSDGFRVLTSADIFDAPPREKPPALLCGLLYLGAVTLINGVSTVGKTTLLYSLMSAAAQGREWFGLRFTRPLRVIYFDIETPEWDVQRRYAAAGAQRGDPFDIVLDIVTLPKDLERIAATIRRGRYDMAVIDTLTSAIPLRDENSNAEAATHMKGLKSLAKDTGAAVVGVRHVGKELTQTLHAVHAARGASAWQDLADVVLNLTPVEKDNTMIDLRVVKDRVTDVSGWLKMRLVKAGGGTFKVTEAPPPPPTARDKVLSALQKLSGATRAQLEAHTGLSGTTVGDELTRLKQAGLIREAGKDGRAPVYELVPSDSPDSPDSYNSGRENWENPNSPFTAEDVEVLA